MTPSGASHRRMGNTPGREEEREKHVSLMEAGARTILETEGSLLHLQPQNREVNKFQYEVKSENFAEAH